MKKTFCILMCLLLATMTLASCATSTPAPSSAAPATSAPAATTAAATESAAATATAAATPAVDNGLPLSPTLVTLTFGTHQGTNSSMAPPSNDLPVYQYLEKLTNVHIEWQTAPYDNYKDVMSTRIASGDKLPDILNLSKLGNYETLAANNVIVAQDDLIAKYGTYINKFFAANPAYKKLMTSPDGKIYCIEDTVLDSDLGIEIMIDKYALQKAGIAAPPTTVDEFYNMLVAFRDKDISGDGTKDEVPLVINKDSLVALGSAFGLQIAWDWNKYFDVKDGKLVSNYSLPAYKDYVTFLNKLYTEGLMNKDYATVSYDKMIEYVSKGQCGAVGYWATYAYLFGDASPNAAQFKTSDKNGGINTPIYVPMDPLKDPAGERFFVKRSGLNGDGMGITVDCKDDLKPIAMKWIDFLFANPASLEVQYFGVPDVTYKKAADGTITKIQPADGSDWGSAVTKIGGNQPPRAHQQLIEGWRNSWLPDWLYEVDVNQKQYYKDGDILPLKFKQDEQDTVDKATTDLDTYIDENITGFITGTKPLSGYDAFAASLGAHGLDAILPAYEARYQRQMSN